ncbi:MAG: outer membrane beta-barrel protein [Verrucomicrobia bacterium]|nr:outer membrane beta-barrel protein [Verrucomicrobiota bacterium]MCH8512960.1 outer membrane beta-barrel protein [Kiritimatiellia bacterium]
MKTKIAQLTLLTFASGSLVFAQPNRLPVDITNTLRVGYDDNVLTTGKGSSTGKQDTFTIQNQIEFLLDREQNATYWGLRYAPSFIYYEDRPGDSTDINHQFDLTFSHQFTPLSRLQVRNTLRAAEEPELVEDDVTVRRRNDFFYNSLNVSYDTQVVPEKTTLRVDGRYAVMRYDDSEVSNIADYDQLVAGLNVIQQLAPNTTGGLEFRYQELSYENNLRDLDAIQVGATFSKIFSPTLQGDVRFGYEYRDADNAVEQTSDSPYIDGSVVFLPAINTRLTVGAGFSKDQSPVNRFAQQERTRFYGTLAQTLTPATTLYVSGSYSLGSFDRDDATSAFNPEIHTDGDETVLRFSTRLAHRLNVKNSIEATYQYTELDSDVRPDDDFERNRVSIAWKYSFQ